MTREEAIYNIKALLTMCDFLDAYGDSVCAEPYYEAVDVAVEALKNSERKAESSQNVQNDDLISRKAAIEGANRIPDLTGYAFGSFIDMLTNLPSAQPERTCVNCGRTANNGGWYADGGTRCPIEEHYALPKDGYCHLWEKRNVTDDDYPERREK